MNNEHDEDYDEEEEGLRNVFTIRLEGRNSDDWVVAYDVEFTATHVIFVNHIHEVQEAYRASDVVSVVRMDP